MDRSTAGVFDTPLPTLINIWLIGNPLIILVYPLIPLILVHTQILVYSPIPSILVQIPKPYTKKPAF